MKQQSRHRSTLPLPVSPLLLSALCLLFAFLPGCATTGDLESAQTNIAAVRVEAQGLKKELEQMRSSIPAIANDLATLKEQGFTAMRESQASLLTQTGELSKEIQVLKGRFDENKYSLDKSLRDLASEREVQSARMTALENEIKELKAKINTVVAERQQQPAGGQEKKEAAGGAEAQSEQKAAENTDYSAPQKLYDDAQIDFKEKRYPEARQKFEKFAKDFPKHALAPNVYFWTGETYYAEKKYDDAILAYESFLKKYPAHDKAKGALLKQGLAFIDMGDKKTGKVILERLIEKYPQSSEAELAEKKIAEVLSKGNGGNGKSKKKKK